MSQPNNTAQAQKPLSEAVRLAASGATVLVPTKRAERFVLGLANAELSREIEGAWPTPDVLPFGAWLERLWASAQLGGLATQVLLSGTQERRLWGEVAPEAWLRSLAAAASNAWRLARQYRIPLDPAAMSATLASRTFAVWASSFQRRCKTESWTDEASLADELLALLPKLELPKQLALYGFSDLTPQQLALLDALRAHNAEVTVLSSPAEVSAAHALCVAADDREAELRLAARWARARVERNPEARVGVVVLALDEVRAMAESVFREVLHPESVVRDGSKRAYEISLGRPLSEVPVAQAALQLLRLCAGELHWMEVSALLRSPYLGGGVVEADTRARLDVELRALLRENASIHTLAATLARTRTTVAIIRPRIELLAKRVPERGTQQSLNYWRAQAESILSLMRWPGAGDGGRPLDSADYQAANRWRKLLGECAALDLLSGSTTFGSFVRELQRAAAGTIFKPEAAQAPVQIMDEREAAGSTFDALWICGASDDALPRRGRSEPFLPLALQREARAPHSSPELDRQAAQRTLANLLALSAQVVISHPLREPSAGGSLRPSPLLAGIPEVKVEDLRLSAENDWRKTVRGEAVACAEDATAPAIAPADIRHASTKLLELQSNCPFRALAERRLGAEKMETPADGLSPIQRGRLVDFALEFLWEQLRDQHGLRAITGEKRQDLVARASEVATTKLQSEAALADEWSMRLLQGERERLGRLLQEWLALEDRRDEPFEVLERQKEVELELAGVRFSGRIDRVDRLGSDFVVIDYKTGAQSYGGADWKPPRMERPQLPFYAAGLMAQGREVIGVALAELKTGDCRFSGYAERKSVLPFKSDRVAKDCDGGYRAHIRNWRPALEVLARQFLDGVAKVDPLKWPGERSNSTCRYCPLPALCRVGELKAPAEAESESDEENGDE